MMGPAIPTAEAFECHKPFNHSIEPCGIGRRLEIIAAFFCRFFVKIGPRLRYSDDVMEISPPTMSRYLDDFTEISPSPDRDISAKWWQYLHQMTEISRPKQRNFFIFLHQYHPKKPFLAQKNCQIKPPKYPKTAKKQPFLHSKAPFSLQKYLFLTKKTTKKEYFFYLVLPYFV